VSDIRRYDFSTDEKHYNTRSIIITTVRVQRELVPALVARLGWLLLVREAQAERLSRWTTARSQVLEQTR